MKKILLLIGAGLVFSGCALLSPYTITFTTPEAEAVNPSLDTLDLVVSQPTLAYISKVECDGKDPIELLPIVSEDMEVKTAHNLSLAVLANAEHESKCVITVTAFDQSTTASASSKITLYMFEKPVVTEVEGDVSMGQTVPGAEVEDMVVEDYSQQISTCEEQGGTWNECGSACEEGDELCIQVCVPKCEFSNDETGDAVETDEAAATEESAT